MASHFWGERVGEEFLPDPFLSQGGSWLVHWGACFNALYTLILNMMLSDNGEGTGVIFQGASHSSLYQEGMVSANPAPFLFGTHLGRSIGESLYPHKNELIRAMPCIC